MMPHPPRHIHPVLLLFAAWLATLAICPTVAAEKSELGDSTVPQPTDIFLLIGQSNMAGRGTVDEAAKQANPRVFSLNKDAMWVPAIDPLHFDKPGLVGVGPGKTFG
ncbi:MAG: sialate O-acetylesterase, partial [Planctomycetota bacterium]